MGYMNTNMSFVGIVVTVLLVQVLLFVLTRWFWNWYYKMNARLNEQRKTNELLQNVYDALLRGDPGSAVTAGQIVKQMNENANR